MLQVLAGFSVVWVIIGIGFVVGRMRLLGDNAATVLSRMAFFVANPALLFVTISQANVREVFGAPLLVAAVSAFVTAGVYAAVSALWLRRSAAETVVSSMSASLVNAANLGLPIASYVLGNAALVAPVMIFQLAFFTPLGILLIDMFSGRGAGSFWRVLAQVPLNIVKNPMIIGAVAGLVVAATGLTVPDLVMDPIALLGGASIPSVLLAFGLSLVGSKPLQRVGERRKDVVLATIAKLVLQPLVAFAVAYFALGLTGPLLFAVVVTAALPTAQNVFVVAMRYNVGTVAAKDTVLVTTIVAIPALIVVAALLA
ncbi:AEC family transporter [Haematomicrobium sanguinis]|uniref:AEC family transporter n=1 Tax=Haematomicrobium sanguinis TaxID=479106 RepID=UPI00047A22C3|nr:AEC family transporter [Haematomicrobium sanguinis]